jgi:hypothetical protein
MHHRSIALACLALIATNVACSGDAAEAETIKANTAALSPGLTGTYDFLLEASDVAAKFRANCTSDNAGDVKRAEQCFDAVRAEAKLEKIRFSRNDDGELVFTSFGLEGDREVVFVEVPIAITSVEPHAFVAKAAGFPRGTLVGRLTHLRAELRVERNGDGTIVMIDPKKGRLAYRRSS